MERARASTDPPPRPPAAGRASLFADRRARLLLGFAAAVRVVVLADLWLHDPLVRRLHSDPDFYHRWAETIAAGGAWRAGEPFWLPPLYPWALGALYRATHGHLLPTLFGQLAIGVASLALLVVLCERAVGRRAALFAGVLWTLYAPVAYFETRLLPVTIAIPLCLGGLLLLQSAEAALAAGRRGVLPALGAGALLGVAAMARPNLLLAGPAAALALGIARRFSAPAWIAGGALALGLAAGVAPSALRNHAESGEWVLVTANGGINFWFGNNPEAHGTFHAPGPEWNSIDLQGVASRTLASEAAGRELSFREASRHWFGEGLDWIASEPADALRLWAVKLGDTLSSRELGIQYYLAATREEARSLWLMPLPFGALLAAAALGFGAAPRGRAVLVAWLAAGLLSCLLYFTYSRFRLPILPALLPWCGVGCARLADRLRGQGRLGAPRVLAALALLALSYVPFEGDYPKLLRAQTRVDMAAAAGERGDLERERELLERALADVPSHAKALTHLARNHRTRGDLDAALAALERAIAVPVEYPPLAEEVARLFDAARASRPAGAAELLRRWLGRTGTQTPHAVPYLVFLAELLHAEPELARGPGEPCAMLALARELLPEHERAASLWERFGCE